MKYASIDIGTNTIRLLIAERYEDCKFNFLHQESRIARLGEGFGRNRTIKKTAIQRAKKILLDYKHIIDDFEIKSENIFSAATSAVREADNKKSFLKEMNSLGINIEIKDSKQEAYLTQKGIVLSLSDILNDKIWLAFDLGGGSTEFMLSRGKILTDSFSIPLGGVKLLEMFIKNDPPSMEELESAAEFFKAKLADHTKNNMRIDFIVGNAGTVTSLAAIDLGLKKYSYEKTEKYTLKKSKIENILNQLAAINAQMRLNRYKILEKGREDVIVIGAKIVETILDFFNKDSLVVTNGSLREGLILKKVCDGR